MIKHLKGYCKIFNIIIKNTHTIKKDVCFFMRRKRNLYIENNVTKYDEFVCSEFVWLPINKQKENAERLEEMTREED